MLPWLKYWRRIISGSNSKGQKHFFEAQTFKKKIRSSKEVGESIFGCFNHISSKIACELLQWKSLRPWAYTPNEKSSKRVIKLPSSVTLAFKLKKKLEHDYFIKINYSRISYFQGNEKL